MSTGVRHQYLCRLCRHTVTPTPHPSRSTLICPNCYSESLERHQNPNPMGNSVRYDQFSLLGAGGSAAVNDLALMRNQMGMLWNRMGMLAARTHHVMDGNDHGRLFDGPRLDDLFEQLWGNYLNRNQRGNYLNRNESRPAASPPAARAAVEALLTVRISEEMVRSGVFECSICINSFGVDDLVKELPCKHVFHCDCVLRWLRMRNSCPLCRFKLPTDDVE